MTSGSNYDDPLFPQTKQDKEDDAFVDTTTTTSSAADASVVASPLDRPLLAGLDLGALLLFASVGKASHSNAAGGIDVLAVLWVALPFVVSWFAVTPFLGLYDVAPTMNATASKRRAALMAVKGWVVAIPLGCVLRGVLKGYVPPLPFVVVTLLATLVLMVATRVLYATVQEQIRKEASS